jgi:capsular polysaccharide biosynthesis protein
VFNSNQISNLRQQLATQKALAMVDGYFCRTLHVALATRANARSCFKRPDENVEFYGPEHVFGVPHNSDCLSGIGNYQMEVPGPILYQVSNARIIGHQTLIDADSCLYRPNPLDDEIDPQVALNENSHGHAGFVLHSQDDALYATFASRQEPHNFGQTVLFLHNLEPGNYGSFMFRLLPQLMFVAEMGLEFDVYVTPERTPWFTDALRLLGLPERPVFSTREVCGDQFHSVFFSTEFAREGLFSLATRQDFAKLARQAEASGTPKDTFRKVYVSRMLTGSSRPWYRMLRNEKALEEHAARAGFSILYPETLTFPEQVRVFAAARQIVGPSGSGMLNAVFGNDDARVLDMESFTTTVRQHAKIYSSTRKRYSFLFGDLAEDDGSHPIFRSWVIPEEHFHTGIDWLMR